MSRKPEINESFYASVDYGYSKEQWLDVRNCLDEIGIDIATTVAFVAPWSDHNKPVSRPLGDVLRELAGYYGALARLEDHRLTPGQQAAKAKRMLTKLKAAVAAIDDYYDAGDTVELRMRSVTVLRDLILKIERRKQRYDEQAAKHDGRRENPVAAHTRFWLALMEIWRGLDEAGQQHKHLHEFLFICSKPVFSKATTEATLTSFIERYFPRSNT
jgi:hypothetical protein